MFKCSGYRWPRRVSGKLATHASMLSCAMAARAAMQRHDTAHLQLQPSATLMHAKVRAGLDLSVVVAFKRMQQILKVCSPCFRSSDNTWFPAWQWLARRTSQSLVMRGLDALLCVCAQRPSRQHTAVALMCSVCCDCPGHEPSTEEAIAHVNSSDHSALLCRKTSRARMRCPARTLKRWRPSFEPLNL